MTAPIRELEQRILAEERVNLFLDYDGTLADFAPTPDDLFPDPDLIELIRELMRSDSFFIAIISGRKLAHLQKLLPINGLLLAGTYGIELQRTDGEIQYMEEPSRIRPCLERLKPAWEELIADRKGFYLEDKDWSLAIHAKHADPAEAEEIVEKARFLASEVDPENFRILGGHRFLEIAPQSAGKGVMIRYLLQEERCPASFFVYIGDDDKDEEAFAVVQELGGCGVKVGPENAPTLAHYRLDSPSAVRAWLHRLIL